MRNVILLKVMIKLKRIQCSVISADYYPVSNLPWLMADVLASNCPPPPCPLISHHPPFSQQLEDMFISTKGAEHWIFVSTTSQQYVPETSSNYSYYNLSFNENSRHQYHLIIENTNGILRWHRSKHLSSSFDNQ